MTMATGVADNGCGEQEERKMTREGFAANNRGIAAGGNLEESFLNEIFDHIRANPISLKEDDTARERGEMQVMLVPFLFLFDCEAFFFSLVYVCVFWQI